MKFSHYSAIASLLLSLSATTNAFVFVIPSSTPLELRIVKSQRRITTTSTRSTANANANANTNTQIFSSNDDDDLDDDGAISDELSKLIGKRASIAKSTPVSSSSTTAPTSKKLNDNEEDGIIEPKADIASLYENKSGMEIFEMPEFTTKRPTRGTKKNNDEMKDSARGGDGSSKDNKEEESGYVDFQADYDDENDFHIPNRLGFDLVAWGDRDLGFRAGKKLKKKQVKRGKFLAGDLQVAYNKLMEAGIILACTSEHYGLPLRKSNLSSEQILGKCMEDNTIANPLIATTMVNPYISLRKGTGLRFGKTSIYKAAEGSAERMGTSAIDLYQVPSRMIYPGPPYVVADALVTALDQGLINNVGVLNMNKDSMKRFSDKLGKRSDGAYALTTNQFEFSLTNRKAMKSGLIHACQYLGVVPIASNPLGNGLASGVYTATDPTGGQVSGGQPFDFETLDKYTTLHTMMSTVQDKVKKRLEKEKNQLNDRRNRYGGPEMNTDVTTTQIAINYVVAKGCVPIPSIKNPNEADELIGCLGWGLTDEEVEMLDNAADLSDQGL